MLQSRTCDLVACNSITIERGFFLRVSLVIFDGLPGAAAVADQFFDGGDVFPGEMLALVFVPEDAAEFDEVGEFGVVIVGPLLVVLELGLDAPAGAELLGADFALFAVVSDVFPDVDVAASHFARQNARR